VQSEMEAGSSTTLAVVPGRQHYHPSAAKMWAQVEGQGTTVHSSYNLTSITDSGVGDQTFTIATDFSSTTYCSVVSIERGTGTNINVVYTTDKQVGSFRAVGYKIVTAGPTISSEDLSIINTVCFGDQ